MFQLIGQRPVLGRDFRPEDGRPEGEPVVIISNGVWKNRYGGDAKTVGRVIKVNSLPCLVIGVMPPDMRFPFNNDIWMPLSKLPPAARDTTRGMRNFTAFGRLGSGVSLGQARAELETIGAQLARDHAATNKDIRPTVVPYNERVNGGRIRTIFLSLMGAVAFVLLIACANVANLLLARSATRSREMSVRVSLGASRWRIVRQLLVESVVLSIIGGVLGLGLAFVGVRLFDAATQDVGKPYWIQFTMDARVFGFFAATCLGTGIVFGLAPALHVSKADLNEVLKEGGRSGSSGVRARRWTSVLIVAELALTLVLLAGAGLMMRSFLTLYRLDLGIETAHLLTMRMALPNQKYPTPEVRRAFYDRLDQRLAGIAGITAGTIASNMPLMGGNPRLLAVEGREPAAGEQPPIVTQGTIGARYFETMGLRLIRGRVFDNLDGLPGHDTAIINQRFASMHFGNEDPLGRRVKLDNDGPSPPGTPPPGWVTIVGIAPSIRQRNFQEPQPDPVVYVPLRAQPQGFALLIIRAERDAASLTSLVREEVRTIDPDLPLFGILTMDQQLAQQRWPFRVFGSMFAIFAFIALALSAVGLYAVTAYSVTQRTAEIGVRMALGAQPPQVLWLVLQRAIVQLAIGIPIGIAGAFGVGRLLQILLVQTSARDPMTIASIALLMIVVSI